jgi:phytoene dehydrogenase-like protein
MLHVIPHLEFGMGTFAPVGGMYAIVEALHQTALSLGVDIQTDTPVQRIQIEGRNVQGVTLADGRHHPADVVVSGADVTPT